MADENGNPLPPSNTNYSRSFYSRLYPGGWDLSEPPARVEANGSGPDGSAPAPDEEPEQAPAQAEYQPISAHYDPFQEPRTFPSGWHLP